MKSGMSALCRRGALGILLCSSVTMAVIVWTNGKALISQTKGVTAAVRGFIPLSAPSHWATFDSASKAAASLLRNGADRTVAATPASRFVGFIGVNVHMAYHWTAYNDLALVKNALGYLGVDQVRDKLLDWPDVQKNYEKLAAGGAKFDFILPAYAGHPNTTNLSEFISMVSAFARAHAGGVTAVEGPNEVNIWPITYDGGTMLVDQAALQQALYAAVRENADLGKIPVYNLTLAYTDKRQFAQLGDLSRAADYANSHAYLNCAQAPEYSLGVILPYAKLDAPALPMVITETGYETNTANAYSGVDQTVQAKLTLDELMDIFAARVSRVYLYELLDEGGENFGLFSANGTPKPAARAIHNLTSILSDPGLDHPSSSRSLNYAVHAPAADTHELLLGKSNGTFDLVLWAESPIWDVAAKEEIAAPAATGSIEFADRQQTVLVFDPLQGTAPIASYHDVQSITVVLADHPVIVEIPSATGSRRSSD
jgi:trimeric autotransporter adhesin